MKHFTTTFLIFLGSFLHAEQNPLAITPFGSFSSLASHHSPADESTLVEALRDSLRGGNFWVASVYLSLT